MDPNPSESRTRRHRLRRWAAEFAIAAAFVAAILVSDRIITDGTGLALRITAAAIPILVLTVWWIFYAVQIGRMDELERAIETRSLAIACAVTVWLTTAWGLVALSVGVPALPLVIVAPLAAVIYGAIRGLLALHYA